MINKEIQKPNVMLLKQIISKGPIYKVTLCTNILNVLEKKVINEIPKNLTNQEFYDLLHDGNRFFGGTDCRTTVGVE
ncbi:hypothetical protein [Ferdinandcohnia sp. SAFN-114]|uniref:hypothetical protein n=1 Tax=Ferdinandcohnia sp. SAFN-114 TaxID=3387275 RepID=UPI003F7CFE54